MEKNLSELSRGFSKLNRQQRLQQLLKMGVLKQEDIEFLQKGGKVDPEVAEHFIENVIGFFQLPLGVALNFRVDQKDYVIPMAVEETSIIAAASKTAKWVRDAGSLTTRTLGQTIIGQIQIGRCQDPQTAQKAIEKNSSELLKLANTVAAGIVKRGGGARDLTVRIVDRDDQPESDKMLVIHIYLDPVDAMGANIINQVCEALKEPVETITGEKVTMCILSNLVDSKLSEARIEFSNIDPELGEGIAEASLFARRDPYRAATNNKGVLNGIDAVLIATGNDWRAVEAGVHGYACQSGQYGSITHWTMEGTSLVGVLRAPIVVGTVGGVTSLHPTARMNLRMMGIESAEHLSRVCAAVGLVQNLGALKALSTVGVVQGHMKLHAANLALAAGARKEEMGHVQARLEELLRVQRRVSLSQAVEVLESLRQIKKDYSGATVLCT